MKFTFYKYATGIVFLSALIFLFSSQVSFAQGKQNQKKEKKKRAKLPPEDITGARLANAQYNFSLSGLKGAVLTSPTSLQFGPDGRLYVSEQGGVIKIFTIKRNAPNDYSVTATEIIELINQMPNYNDNGSLAPSITKRQITSIIVKGTSAQPLLYVSSSDSRIGGPGGDLNLDTNSGIISLLTKNGSAWQKIDLARGFPRSEENHSLNGMQLDEQTGKLYIIVGGFTNAGSPSTNFAYTSEYALSAAILSIDLNTINAMVTKGSGNNAYKYDLPTLDDPTRSNNPDGSDVNDPFGGNDGLNQAKIVTGAPVQIYSPGFRNAYGLLITKTPGKAGRMYTIDNGANQGWGGYPENEGSANVTNNYVVGEPGSTTEGQNDPVVNNLDNLHYIGNVNTYTPGSLYGGHPNPVRANPSGAGLYTHDGTTGVWRTSKTGPNLLPADWPPIPLSNANIAESNYQSPGVNDLAMLTFNCSTNGLAEYTASNFDSGIKGSLLAAGLNGDIFKISLTEDGTDVTNPKAPANKLNEDLPFASGFGSEPLAIVAQGDSDVYPGTVWVATIVSEAITIFEPQDFLLCTGKYDSLDDDSDGYTNADEIDNATQPCSAASLPDDVDQDRVSDLNDPDDDNDGLQDNIDYFPLDANNGLFTRLPIRYNLFNNDPGTGIFGLGFTGLQSNKKVDNDYIELYNEDSLIAGGAVGAFTVVAVSPGDALGTLNNQENGFQFGFKPEQGTGPFTIKARMLGPFFNSKTPVNYQSQGIFLGTGDQSNYFKIALNANGGAGGIEVVYENADVPVTYQFTFPGNIPGSTLDLILSIDPITGKVQPKYSANGGAEINLGSPIQVSGALLNALQGAPALAAGIISTSRGASPFTANWDYIYITFDPVTATGTWQTITPTSGLPIGREEHSFVEVGDKFYMIGGRGYDPIQMYDPANKTWVNKALLPMELNHFQGVTLGGLVYVAGAFTGLFPHETPVPKIYMYNPLSDKWLDGASIPLARRRGAAGAVAYKNKIYLVAGIKDGHYAGWVKWFDEYDPVTNTWKTLPDAPRARDHFHAVVINDKLYVAGGRRSSDSTQEVWNLTIPEVDVYDFVTGQWSTLPPASNIPTPRAGAATAALGNEVIVIGGESAQLTAHIETEALNVETNVWRRVADLQQRRYGTPAIQSNNGLYVVSGAARQGGGNLLTSMESFYFFNPTTPNGAAPTQSQLTATLDSAFNVVPLNGESNRTVTLTNTGGSQDILVSSIAISGSAAFSYSMPVALPFIIPAGKTINVSVKFKPVTSGSHTASLVVNHSGQNVSTTTSLSGGAFTSLYRINAGGGEVTNSMGVFAADAFYSPTPGNIHSTTSAIAGTTDDAIYQTERFNGSGTFSYAFPVSNGQYTVVLHFAEISFTTVNSRIFDVTLEGTIVLDNYDIVGKAGAFTATTETFVVNVTDGTLDLFFSSLASVGGKNSPKVSAVEILSASSNQAPVANAGADKTVTLPASSTSLSGSGTDADGTVVGYTWNQVSGPNTATFSSKTVAAPTVSGLIAGTYVFSLVVTDNQGALSTADQVSVIVSSGSNQVPVANAGADITITLPTSSASLSGSGTDADGTVVGYSWNQVSGPNTATFSSKTVAAPTVSGLIGGTYVFSLVVTDNQGASSIADQVSVIVNSGSSNQIPVANAGADKTVTLPANNTNLSGSGTDADGTVVGYTWNQVSGPNTATFSSKTVAAPTVSGLIAGTYVFSLVVTDNQGASSVADQVSVTVNSSSSVVYRINAGGGQVTNSMGTFAADAFYSPTPGNTHSTTSAIAGTTDDAIYQSERFNGSGTFSYGFPVSNGQYTIVLHFAEIFFTTINNRIFDVTLEGAIVLDNFDIVGKAGAFTATTETFVVNVTDGTLDLFFSSLASVGGKNSPKVSAVEILSASSNQAPVANAGADKTVTLPANSTSLSGSGTDADGTVVGYTWNQVSGPNTATFSSKTVAAPTVSGLIAGTYVFSLVVTDNQGASSIADQVSVIVSSGSNQAPVANAGADKTVTLPANSTTLTGSGTDADGTVVGYSWNQVSGPNTATFSSTTVAAPTVSGLIAGTYVFSLVVTDNQGASSTADQVSVVVSSASNQAPIANAGADKAVTLPANSTTLRGSGTDADGTVVGYTWNQVSGPNTATFSSKTVAAPTVSGLIAGTYVFSLVVTDNQGASSIADQVSVTVNASSTVVYRINAGGGQVTNSIGTFAADAFYSPTPGSTHSTTSAIAGTTDDAIYQTERFNGSGTFSYGFPVSNGQYTVVLHFAEIYFTAVNNRIFDVTLEGAIVLDNFDIVGKAGAFTATTETFVVNVTDGTLDLFFSSLASVGGKNSPKVSAVEILSASSNQAPVANAGADKTVTLPANSTSLTGSGTDADGTVVGHSWNQVSGPNTATFSSKTVAAPTVSGLIAGTYVFSLVVTDNQGASSIADQVSVIVSSGSNQAPVANAGADKAVTLPTNSTTLSGSGTDADGTVVGYSWNQVSGPNTATFSSKTVAAPTVSGLIAGIYVFSLVVTDNQGASSVADQVSVIVSSGSNQAPVANAGADKTVTLPANSTNLSGSGTDADGTVVGYTWNQVSGPNTATFSSKTVAAPTVSGLIAGTYVFSLIVSDNQGASSIADQVSVTVNASSTVVYRINAGGGQVTNSIGTFAADAFYSPTPGNTHSTTSAIAGTTDDAIYQTERFNGSGTFSYGFPVTNGQYTVVLHFAEIFFTAVNKRVFDVKLEGAIILDNFDIVRKAGAFTATTETFVVNVTDGTLNLFFSSLANEGGKNSAKVSAIEILSSSVSQASVANMFPGDRVVPSNPVEANDSTQKLTVAVRPNPSAHHFALHIVSGNNKPFRVRVFNTLGKLIEDRANIAANNVVRLGNNYRPGLYYAEVLQGNEKVIVKIVKLLN